MNLISEEHLIEQSTKRKLLNKSNFNPDTDQDRI